VQTAAVADMICQSRVVPDDNAAVNTPVSHIDQPSHVSLSLSIYLFVCICLCLCSISSSHHHCDRTSYRAVKLHAPPADDSLTAYIDGAAT